MNSFLASRKGHLGFCTILQRNGNDGMVKHVPKESEFACPIRIRYRGGYIQVSVWKSTFPKCWKSLEGIGIDQVFPAEEYT